MSRQQQKIARVLADAGQTLRKVASERDGAMAENGQLRQKLASVETRLMCEKIAAEMHEKGLRHDIEFPELVDDLEKSASEGKLPVIMEAVKMAAPNMGNHFSINNDEASGIGMSDFEAYLVGNVG